METFSGVLIEYEHEPRHIGMSRGDRGRRTIFYGTCKCGAGTTNSANQASVLRKLARHAAGDNRGIFKP